MKKITLLILAFIGLIAVSGCEENPSKWLAGEIVEISGNIPGLEKSSLEEPEISETDNTTIDFYAIDYPYIVVGIRVGEEVYTAEIYETIYSDEVQPITALARVLSIGKKVRFVSHISSHDTVKPKFGPDFLGRLTTNQIYIITEKEFLEMNKSPEELN